jgi:hypothetical protein
MKGLFLQKPLTAMGYFYLFLELYRRRVLSEWVFVGKRLEGRGGAFAAFTHTHQTNHSQFRRYFEEKKTLRE